METDEKDLTEAQATAELPTVYPNAELGRATKGAVTALLGKVYLYQKKWVPAQTELQKLMGAPYTYQLDPSLIIFSAPLTRTQRKTSSRS